MYNANQLSNFLLHFVASNYQDFENTEKHKLTGDNLSYVKEHRWLPLSYYDAMEKWMEKYGEHDLSVRNRANKRCSYNDVVYNSRN